MVQLTLPKNSVPVKGKTYSNVELIDEQGQNNADISNIAPFLKILGGGGAESAPSL